MDTKALRQKILDLAIRGKLVPQDPNDEPASVLLERIRAEKQQMVKDGKLKAKDIKNDTVIFKGDDSLHYEQLQDGTVKCIEDEIPFELPDGWTWVRINTACIVNPRNNIDDNTEVSFVPMANISEGYANSFVSDSRLWRNVKTGYTHFAENDIGIAKITPCFENKKSVVFTGLINGYGAGTTELHIIRTISGLIVPEYLLCFAKRNDFILGGVQTFSGDVGQQRVTKDYIANYLVSLPPLNEQKRIISAIKEAYYIIENIEKTKLILIEDVKKAKSKILDLAIRGKLVPQDPNDEPASVLLERIRAEKEELIKQGKIKRDKKESVIFKGDDNSYYEEIPWNWICCNVKSVMQYIRNGATIKQSKDATGIPITRIETISQEFIDYTKMGYANIFKVDNYQSFVLNSGDILMSHINSPKHLCKCAIYNHTEKNEVVLHGMNLLSLRPVVHETSKFLLYMFRSSEFKAYVYKNMKHSVNQASITATDIGNYTFLLPPLAEQKRIVEAIETAFAQLDEILNSIS